MTEPSLQVSCGIDLVDLDDFRKSVRLGGDNFLRKCFSHEEIQECAGRPESLAGRFAAKEATTKALGTGIRGITLDQIVIAKNKVGKPHLRLAGDALRLSKEQCWVSHDVSISHSENSACAVVVALRESEYHED